MSDALENFSKKHKAARVAQKEMDAAWAEYCRRKREWERLDRESAEAFEPIWNGAHP